MDLLERIESLQANIGVIGLGYVGLPLVREFAGKGFSVIGFDVDETKVESLNSGRSYIKHIPSSLIEEMTSKGLFAATTDYGRLTDIDCILICVPTPLDRMKEPDLSYVRKSVESIAKTLCAGQLVVLESTTYPTTTEDLMLPLIEESSKQNPYWEQEFVPKNQKMPNIEK